MKDMPTIANYVEIILLKDKESRSDNDRLYVEVCKEINPLCVGKSLENVLINRGAYNLPNYESVTRARRNLVKENPELDATDKTKKERRKRTKEILDYVAQ